MGSETTFLGISKRNLNCSSCRPRICYYTMRFSVAGPCLWYSLPVTLRDRDISFVQFKRLL